MLYTIPIDPFDLESQFTSQDVELQFQDPLDPAWVEPRLDKIRTAMTFLPARERDLVFLYYFKNKRQTDIAEIFGVTQAAVSYRLRRANSRLRFLVNLPEITRERVQEILQEILDRPLDVRLFTEMYYSTCQSDVATKINITQGRVRHRFLCRLTDIREFAIKVLQDWLVNNTLDSIASEDLDILADDFQELLEDTTLNRRDEPPFQKRLGELIPRFQDYMEDEDEAVTQPIIETLLLYQAFEHIRYNFNILHEVRLPKWVNRPTNTIY